MNVCGTSTSHEIFQHNYKHTHTHRHASFTRMKVEEEKKGVQERKNSKSMARFCLVEVRKSLFALNRSSKKEREREDWLQLKLIRLIKQTRHRRDDQHQSKREKRQSTRTYLNDMHVYLCIFNTMDDDVCDQINRLSYSRSLTSVIIIIIISSFYSRTYTSVQLFWRFFLLLLNNTFASQT